MKKVIALIAMLVTCACAQAQFAFELAGQVAFVDDGDTIILHPGSQRIRLAEIDAPETDHGTSRPGQPYGQASRAALAAMMPVGSDVVAKCYEYDRNKRAVCRLFYQNIDISLEMVRLGHAHAYVEYNHDPRVIGAAEHAKTAQIGLWASGNAVYPQTWRRNCWNAESQPLYCSNSESGTVQATPPRPKKSSTTPASTGATNLPTGESVAALLQFAKVATNWLQHVQLP